MILKRIEPGKDGDMMTNEFENMPTAPTLTLDPFQEEKKAPAPVEKQDPVMDDAILSPEENRR